MASAGFDIQRRQLCQEQKGATDLQPAFRPSMASAGFDIPVYRKFSVSR